MSKGSRSLPQVAVIVLNWNSADDTLECLASLSETTYPNRRIIVVDNASQDGSPDLIREQFDNVDLIRHTENAGFTGGNNIGIERALTIGADYILLLNNDTVVEPGFIEPLVEALEADHEAAAAGPLIYYYDQDNGIWFGGGRIRMLFGQSLHLHHRASGLPDDRTRSVEFMTGCAFMVRSDVVRELGPLYPDFFLCCEDLEYSMRIRRAGYRILFIPRAVIRHKVARTLGGLESPTYLYYQTRNRLLFMRLHARWYHWPSFILHFAFSYVFKRFIIFTIQRRPVASYRAVVLGISDFLAGRFGILEHPGL